MRSRLPQWLISIERGNVRGLEGIESDAWMFAVAALHGQVGVMEHFGGPMTYLAFVYAVEGGHMRAMEWLREKECPWNAYVCERAAQCGNLEALRWLREHGCPWTSDVLFWAVQHKNSALLRWALENGCPRDPSVMDTAIWSGYRDGIKMLKKRF